MVIEGRELCLIYDLNTGEDTYALRDVDLVLKPGELTGIIGPSGSGKSSLLYVLSGLKKPTTGTIYYDEIDIESIPSAKQALFRRKSFGFIFQRHFLIDYLSVLDNVLIGSSQNSDDSEKEALELLDEFGIKHLSNKRPFELSVGQRQRVAVARALINDPSVIFADEPTASLDHKNAREVMRILEGFKANVIIAVVTHDRSILENADRIIEMWDGHIQINTNRQII